MTNTFLAEPGLATVEEGEAVYLTAEAVQVVAVVVSEAAEWSALVKGGARVRIGDWGSVVKSVAVVVSKPFASTSSATILTVGTVSVASLKLHGPLSALSHETTTFTLM